MKTDILTLVASEPTSILDQAAQSARDMLTKLGATVSDETDVLSENRAIEFSFSGFENDKARADSAMGALRAHPDLNHIDLAITPEDGRRKKVLVADMDSTMIQIETLDTMASFLGLGEEVAEITKRSMDGELDFVESLRARVSLLKGLEAKPAMDHVMAEVRHTDGAEVAVKTMRAHGCNCRLVSGGFTFTTQVVHAALGFDGHAANTLEIDDQGFFTGALTGAIVGRPSKLEIMTEMCELAGIDLDLAVGIGDGANDLDMLMAAGLGIGFHPKPIVRKQARYSIEHTDMRTLAYYQGYRDAEFVA